MIRYLYLFLHYEKVKTLGSGVFGDGDDILMAIELGSFDGVVMATSKESA